MKTEVVNVGDSLVVCPEIDNLDAYLASEFKSEVNALVENVTGHVVLDLRHISFVDSAGLGAILSVMRLVRSREKRLVICMMTPPVRSLFELVRIHKVLDICNSREEALLLL
jgi:anti-sigma B factor antagonist